MKNIHLLFTVLMLAIVSVCRGQIRCYVCSTQGGPYSGGCGDKFSLTSIDASTCQGSCLKARGRRQAGRRTEIEVNRGCAELRSEGCSKGDYLGMSGADICYCNTEVCNTASSRVISLWSVGLATLLSTLIVSLHV